MRLTTSVDGEERLFKALDKSTDIDFRESGPEVQKEFFEVEGDQFNSAGARGASGKWAPLTRATEEAKGFLGGIILVRSGALKASLSRKGAEGQVYEARKDELTVGSNIPYGVFHQRGTKRMPARPPISITDDQRKKMMKPVVRQAAKKARSEGFTQVSIGEI